MDAVEIIFIFFVPLLLTSIIKMIFMRILGYKSGSERAVVICANLVVVILTALVAALFANVVDEPIMLLICCLLLVILLECVIYRIAFGEVRLLLLKVFLSNLIAALLTVGVLYLAGILLF